MGALVDIKIKLSESESDISIYIHIYMRHIFCWGCENKLKTNRGVHKRAAQQPKQPNMSIKTMFAVELTGLHFTQP